MYRWQISTWKKATMWYHYTPIRIAKIKEQWQHQMLPRIQRNWITHILLVEIENGTATVTNSLAVSSKTKNTFTIQLSSCTLGYLFQRNEHLRSHKISTWIFIADLFVLTKNCKQHRCPSIGEWLHKPWCNHTMEYVGWGWGRGRNTILIHTTSMNLQKITLS